MENFNTVPSTGKYGDSVAVINENFMLAQQEMEMLRQIYNSVSQSQPIPVTTLPATGEAGKIYRLAGTNSYADYMYAESDLTTPIKMAEYDNAIDDEPTAGSNNLVKSGGVALETALIANSSPLRSSGTTTVVEMNIANGKEYNVYLKSDINVGGYIRVGLGGSGGVTNRSIAVSPEDVLAGKVVSLVSVVDGSRIYTSSTDAQNHDTLDDYSNFNANAVITWRVQPNKFDNQVKRNKDNIEKTASKIELYEPGYNYFSRTTPTKWNENYKISRLLKVTNDVSITDVCTPTANDACCVLYDKDGTVIDAKLITAESYTAYDNISASDLTGAAFFRICGDMRRPPVFNYVPSFAIDYTDEEYLTGEDSIGVDVASASGNYQTYNKAIFNHYDEAHNMLIVGLKAKFTNNSTDIDIMVLDRLSKTVRVIQTIPKESLKVGSYAYTYVKLKKPFILKANEWVGFNRNVAWKNVPVSTESNPTINTIGGSTIGDTYTTIQATAVFDYHLFVRKVENFLFDKKLSVITDSIGTSAYVTNPERVYWKALANHTGMTVLGTSTIGGSSITPGLKSDSIKPFVDPDRIAALAVDGVNPDIIIIQGGVNDFNAISADGQHPCPIGSWSDDPTDPSLSFYASTRCLLGRLKTAYPKSNIIFCTPPKMFATGKLDSFEPLTNKEGVKMSAFVDVIKDVSKEYGVLCVDLFSELPVNKDNYTDYYADTYHAKDTGCALIEDLLLNKMIALYGYM